VTPRLADRPSAPAADTPLMQQYRDIKARHPGAILFFRMGDFYEMFEDDAKLAARELGLTLTSRNNGGAAEVPLAGVPVKAATDYLRRLIAGGHKVAICEQVEDPKLAKGLVRREVVETRRKRLALVYWAHNRVWVSVVVESERVSKLVREYADEVGLVDELVDHDSLPVFI